MSPVCNTKDQTLLQNQKYLQTELLHKCSLSYPHPSTMITVGIAAWICRIYYPEKIAIFKNSKFSRGRDSREPWLRVLPTKSFRFVSADSLASCGMGSDTAVRLGCGHITLASGIRGNAVAFRPDQHVPQLCTGGCSAGLWRPVLPASPSGYDGNSLQWNLSVTTTSIMKYITCDLFSNVF